MARALVTAVLALAVAGIFAVTAEAIRNKPKPETDAPKPSTQALSTEALNSGLDRLTAAERAELKGPTEARSGYQAALKDLQKAVSLSPDNYRAHNAMGYAYRKLGRYDRALESYERALSLAPNFSEAIAYRAEAYLGLNRLEETKQAYMHLFVNDRANAGILMKAMKAWLEIRRTNAAGVSPAVLSAFETWVHERDTLAASTLNLGHNSPDWK